MFDYCSIEMNEDDQRNIKLYQSLLAEHGDSFRSFDWGSRESQIKRFEILADVGISAGDSVLDVGCGLADFNEWLQQNRPGVNYSGIDITPEMIMRAKARFPDVDLFNATIFDLKNPEKKYDYVVASGIFFFRKENPMDYMVHVINSMFRISSKGVAFNSLSTWAKNRTDGEFLADPCEVIDYCRTLSPFVGLRHDYHAADFSVFLYHEQQ